MGQETVLIKQVEVKWLSFNVWAGGTFAALVALCAGVRTARQERTRPFEREFTIGTDNAFP